MIELLKKVSLFHRLRDDQLMLISELCNLKEYKAGTILFQENEIGTVFYIVVQGAVKVFTSNGAEEKLLALFTSGDAFGELALLDGNTRSATAQALEDTKVLSITANSFLPLLQGNFEITHAIIKELCGRLRDTNNQVFDLTFEDDRKRVIKCLVKLALKHGTRNGHLISMDIKLNHNELSQMAGVTSKVLVQAFQDLVAKQILSVKGQHYVLNLAKL